MEQVANPLNIYVAIVIAGAGATYVWRALGVVLAGRLTADSPVVRGVELIAYGLISALMARVVIFPIGPVEDIPMIVRLLALAAAIFVATRFRVEPLYAVLAGMAVIASGLLLIAA